MVSKLCMTDLYARAAYTSFVQSSSATSVGLQATSIPAMFLARPQPRVAELGLIPPSFRRAWLLSKLEVAVP